MVSRVTHSPNYLLKCLQDWFQHHGDELYDELKHIRNALDQILASATSPSRCNATRSTSNCSFPPIA